MTDNKSTRSTNSGRNANGNPKTPPKGDKTPKNPKKASKFVGATDDLKGYVTTADNSGPNDYNNSIKKLVPSSASKYTVGVPNSIEDLKPLTPVDPLMPPGDPALWRPSTTHAQGQPI